MERVRENVNQILKWIVGSLYMFHIVLVLYEYEIKVSDECKEFWFILKTSLVVLNVIVCINIVLVKTTADI